MTRLGLILGAVIATASIAPASEHDAAMRDTMDAVLANMRVLLELSADEDALRDPANSRTIVAAANELGDQASMVSEHAPRDEVSFLASSLDRYARWIRRSYEWQRFDTVQRLIAEAVEVCVACHTRLPSRDDAPVALDLLTGRDLGALPPWRQARLQIATRRFDDALATLETILEQGTDHERFEEAIRAYLVVSLRVKGDPARARRALVRLAGRDDIPRGRVGRLEAWLATLRRLELGPATSADLSVARALVVEAEARRQAGLADALVHYVEASRLLHEYLEAGIGSAEKGATAYWLLGLCQYRLERDHWLPQTELFLEKAIRTAPASDAARQALALLRVKVAESFARDGSRRIPDDVRRHLDMLAEMVGSGG